MVQRAMIIVFADDFSIDDWVPNVLLVTRDIDPP